MRISKYQYDYIDVLDTFPADKTSGPLLLTNIKVMSWPDVNSNTLNRRKFVEDKRFSPTVFQLSNKDKPLEKVDKFAE